MRLLCGVGVGAWNREQIRADRPELPLAAFGEWVVVRDLGQGLPLDAQDPGEVGVGLDAKGVLGRALGDGHGGSKSSFTLSGQPVFTAVRQQCFI